MNFKRNTSQIEVFLQASTENSINLPIVRNASDIETLNKNKLKTKQISFENVYNVRDSDYLLKKLEQFKEKQYERIFNGAMKLLKVYPNYLYAYLFAGASAFKIKKHKSSGNFYLSCATLVNPNCSSAWEGLLKYCKKNVNIDHIVFETVFLGYLLTERKLDKWQNTVIHVLSPEINFSSRNPLPIVAPFLHQEHNYCDVYMRTFVAGLLSLYLFNQTSYIKSSATDQDNVPEIAMTAFLVYCDNVNEDIDMFYKKALAFFINIDASNYINFFILRSIHHLKPLVYSNPEFIIGIINLLFMYNLDPTYQIIEELTDAIKLTNRLEQLTSKSLFILTLICQAQGDYRRICDYAEKQMRGGTCLWKLNIITVWNYINLQDIELSWKTTEQSMSECVSGLRENRNLTKFEKRSLTYLHFNIYLYLLTHSSDKLMQRLGLILCLKLVDVKFDKIELYYYACIAGIGLNEIDVVTFCLWKLSSYGAFNEVLFLKSLLDEQYTSKTMYLKEIQDLRSTHLLTAVLSNKFEKESKALKSFYKASVMVPDGVFLYEWLGIYSYENQDIEKAKLYFELALFYNPNSWTSINYYSTILALDDLASCKLFLSLYDIERHKNLSFLHLLELKAGLSYFKHKPTKQDYFKACEYFRRCLKRCPENRYYKELLAEAYSKFGMIGSGLKCFKECYIINKHRHLYSGSRLGKQYLFVKGATKYLKMMKYVANSGGMDAFIVLHNTAHALLIKSIQLSTKKHFFLSQIYCQQALFFCVRATSIASTFSSIWKLMGDILFQCSNLGYSAGFLYVPHWLLPEYTSEKIILIRRFQSILLSIRCYYAGLNTEGCTKEMTVCLWNSISVALRKLSLLSNKNIKQKILNFAIHCSFKSLKIDINNSVSWNILGVLINDQGLKNHDVTQNAAFMALNTSVTLGSPVAYALFSTCNAGFIAVTMNDYENAYKLFLSARGTYSSLDTPWFGEMLINLLLGNITGVIQNIVYLYLLTKHSPTLSSLMTSLLFLSPFCTDQFICYMGEKYKHYSEADDIHFKNYFLSGMVKSHEQKYKYALTDFIFALRTCFPLDHNDHATYYSIVQELFFCLYNNRMESAVIDNYYFILDKSGIYSLYEIFLNQNMLHNAYVILLKGLKWETNKKRKAIIYYLLSVISYKGNLNSHAKYYFLKGSSTEDFKEML